MDCLGIRSDLGPFCRFVTDKHVSGPSRPCSTTPPNETSTITNFSHHISPLWPLKGKSILKGLYWCFFICWSGVLPRASCQIVPRASAWTLQNSGDSNSSFADSTFHRPWQDQAVATASSGGSSFAVPPVDQQFLQRMFDQKERVTVASSSWTSSSPSSQPKNAVLIDSILLKTTAVRPSETPAQEADPSLPSSNANSQLTSTTLTPATAPSVPSSPAETDAGTGGLTPVTTITLAPLSFSSTPGGAAQGRQAKRQPTGRPNFFYLGDEPSDPESDAVAGNFFTNLDEIESDAAAGKNRYDNKLATTTADPLAGFYGTSGSRSTNESSRLPFPFASPTSSSPSINIVNGGGSSGNTKINETVIPAQGGQAPLQSPSPPLLSKEAAQRQSYESAVRRQGGVFNAPSPMQPPGGNFAGLAPGYRSRGPPSQSNNPGRRPPFNIPPRGQPGSDDTVAPDYLDVPPPFQVRPQMPSDPFPSNSDNSDGGIKLETCSVGDDSTCTDAFNEVCRVDDGAATCLCRLGSARLRLREPCRGVLSYLMYVRINRLDDHELRFGPQFTTRRSRAYMSLERQVILGVDSLMRMSKLGTDYAGSRLNSFSVIADDGLLANTTITLFKGLTTEEPVGLPATIQEVATQQLTFLQRRLGNSNLYVGSLLTAVPGVQDINECISPELNNCPANVSTCSNTVGSFVCTCRPGYGDRHAGDPLRSGRTCETCEEAYCNLHGVCLLDGAGGGKICRCNGWYIGATCGTDGQVVAVACGSSAIAVILIAITLVFLLRWSRGGGSSGYPSSTLGRSEISANTFTYVKNSPPLATLSQSSDLENQTRMAFLVHPSLVTVGRNQMASHHRGGGGGSDQLLDSNFYEVRPPPGRMGPSQALMAAELLYRKQKQHSASRDHLAGESDVSSLESQAHAQSRAS